MKRAFLFLILLLGFSTQLLSQEIVNKSDSSLVKQTSKSTSEGEGTISDKINGIFEPIVEIMSDVLFFDPFEAAGLYDPTIHDENGNVVLDDKGEPKKSKIPFVVLWLIIGAVFFTIFMKFINIRGFRHAISLVRGAKF